MIRVDKNVAVKMGKEAEPHRRAKFLYQLLQVAQWIFLKPGYRSKQPVHVWSWWVA